VFFLSVPAVPPRPWSRCWPPGLGVSVLIPPSVIRLIRVRAMFLAGPLNWVVPPGWTGLAGRQPGARGAPPSTLNRQVASHPRGWAGAAAAGGGNADGRAASCRLVTDRGRHHPGLIGPEPPDPGGRPGREIVPGELPAGGYATAQFRNKPSAGGSPRFGAEVELAAISPRWWPRRVEAWPPGLLLRVEPRVDEGSAAAAPRFSRRPRQLHRVGGPRSPALTIWPKSWY